MTRTLRILQSTTNAVAPPPETVAIESDFVVILAALLCSLICVVGLIAVARCAWLRRGSGATGELPRRSLANKGIKKKVLQSMPKFTYINSNPSQWVASSECAICLADFVEGDEIRVLPQCGHGFHVRCIDPWLGSHSSCPSCRALLAVPRCQKCGQYPAVVGGGGSGGAAVITVIETELKSTEGGNGNAAANNNSVIIGANVMSHHHSQSVNGFLP